MKDYFGFQGKTVVVTGASSGMGEAAAKMLVDLGAEVHACGSGKRSRITYGPANCGLHYDAHCACLAERHYERITTIMILPSSKLHSNTSSQDHRLSRWLAQAL